MAKPGAGGLRARLVFQRRTVSDDGFGNPVTGDFADVFACWGELVPRFGGEAVINARLQGSQPYTVRIRQSAEARHVGPEWRVVDERDRSRVFAITSPLADMTQRGAYLEFMAIAGDVKQ